VDRNEVLARLTAARGEFLDHERPILAQRAGERALTSKFASYLERVFPDWDVNAEYDRLGEDLKRLKRRNRAGSPDLPVRPDIVVHRIGKKSNLLVIEAKKDDGSDEEDLSKLSEFKVDPRYEYNHAAFIRFVTGPAPNIIINLL
jgi:hypothetical protein